MDWTNVPFNLYLINHALLVPIYEPIFLIADSAVTYTLLHISVFIYLAGKLWRAFAESLFHLVVRVLG